MNKVLTVEDVKQVIEKVKGAGTDPVGIARELFEGLGDTASVTGEVLQQGLLQAGLGLPGDATNIFGAIQTLDKTGDDVKLTLTSELQPEVRGIKLKLGPTITGAIQKFPDGIALTGINGISVNQFIWIDIQRLQFKDSGGKRSVKVDTNFGGKEFNLP